MIAIASDHAGYNLKSSIIEHLKQNNIDFIDLGTNSTQSVDYPVYAKKLTDNISSGKCEKGILVCGTGIGMSMCANKVAGIRAAVCTCEFEVTATRAHNNANVLCLGERVISKETALKLVDLFLNTPYEGGRHQTRLDMMAQLEK